MVDWLAQQQQQQQPAVEKLWLGPVFDRPETVLSAISTLPASVKHLDLDIFAGTTLGVVLWNLFKRTHMPLIAFDAGQEFLIVDRGGKEANCEQQDLDDAVVLEAP